MSYNGWSTYETWLVNIWYGDYFNDLANEGFELDPDYIRNTVEEFLESEGNLPETGLAADFINAALKEVNWDELYSHYVVEEDEDNE
jgi:hypothetical protein